MLRLLPGGPRASIASCVVVAVALSTVVLLFAPQRLRAQPPQTITTATVDDRGVVSIGTAVTAPRFHPSRALVRFRPGRAPAALPGSPSLRNFPGQRDLYLVENPPGLSVAEVVRRYRSNPNVLYAEPDYLVSAVATAPNDSQWAQQWDMVKIATPAAWDAQTNAGDVVVAIVDTGIDFTHPDLQGNIWTNPADSTVHGYTCMNNVCAPGGSDDFGHGTHVGGTIGAVGNNALGIAGINWSVQLLSLKFLDANGSGYSSDAVLCFNLMKQLKQQGVNIRISSNSWGGGGYSQALKDAMAAAEDAGVVHVCAAGNSNVNADAFPMYPAAYDNRGIISVLATDANDVGAGFTNYGLANVDIAAPGVSTLSTVPTGTCALCDPTGYKPLSGTSMATPHVSGVLAALLHRYPSLSTNQARDVVLNPSSYDALTDTKATTSSTGGRLNFAKVLASPLLPNPPLNGFPVISMGPDVFANAGSQVSLSATASDPDSDPLRIGWAKSASAGSLWLFGSMIDSVFPNPSGSGVSFTAPALARTALVAYDASAADGRGGSDHGRDYVAVAPASSPGGPPSGTLTVSPTDAPAGSSITVTYPAADPEGGPVRWDFWIGQNGGASGTCCFTGSSTSVMLNSAGVYRFSTQAVDRELNFSARQNAVVRIGGATGDPPLISAVADRVSGTAPFTMNVDMSGSTDAGGTIVSYYFNCGGGVFTPGSQSSKGSCTFNTPGTYWLLLQVSDDKRNNDIMSLYAVATPPPPGSDTDPPTVAITGPANGSYGHGSVAITANASDNIGVTRVDFYLDTVGGTPIGSSSRAPYSVFWDTTTVVNGAHSLYAVARDAAGNTATSSAVAVTVDNAPPSVAITSPAANSHVSGNVSLRVNAADNFGIARVDYYLDSPGGASIGSSTASPYSITWNANSASSGSHTLYAVARDAAGNTGTSSGVVVTVDALTLPQVTITSPANGATVSRKSRVTIQASATQGTNQIARVEILVGSTVVCSATSAPYQCVWGVPAPGNRTYQIRANAYDTSGNMGSSGVVTVTSR